jgi:hypothetical protein
MNKKILLITLVISVGIGILVANTDWVNEYLFDAPVIRSVVTGDVYQGEIYTTLIDLQKLEPFLPSSTPYAVVLNSNGSLKQYVKREITAIDYQKYPDGSYSIGNFGGEYREKSGGYDLYNREGTILTRFTIKDNPDTDVHGIIKLENGNFIIPSYKLHIDEAGNKIESFLIEEQTVSGEVVFVWDSMDHIKLDEAEFIEQRVWWKDNNINDYFHGNSIAEARDGNLLLSGRHINAVIKINKITGAVMWRLGGKQSDFAFVNDPEQGFSHQHSVHELPNGNILLFDNGNLRNKPYSRVVEYAIDEEQKTATLVWTYTDGRFCFATGSVQRLPNGNTLIGWGIEKDNMKVTVPRITEVDKAGIVVLQVYFPDKSGFYNAFKQ